MAESEEMLLPSEELNEKTREKHVPMAGPVKVVGLGGAGSRIVGRLAEIPEASWLKTIAVDTDSEAMDACGAEIAYCADREMRGGKGCGGSFMNGQGSFSRERRKIRELISGASLLVVTGGFGGGVGAGGAPIIAGEAKNAGIPTIFVYTTPFAFEGHGRRQTADYSIRELLGLAGVLFCLPNDLLFSSLDAEVAAEEAFRMADQEVARAILGVAEIIRCRNLLPVDFADFSSVLHQKRSVCGIGVGTATSTDGLNRGHLAMERMLQSPFLGGVNELRKADAVFLILTGGPEMNLGEMKKVLDTLAKLAGGKSKITVGANTDPSYRDCIQLTVITAQIDQGDKDDEEEIPAPRREFEVRDRRDKEEEPLEKSASAGSQGGGGDDLVQGSFQLQNVSRGIFHNSSPTRYGSEDLDIPTFQRREIIIDRGE